MLRVTLVFAVLALLCAAPARAARTVVKDMGDAVHVFVAGSDGALYHAPPGGVLERVGGSGLTGPITVVSGSRAQSARGAGGSLTPNRDGSWVPLADGLAGPPDALLDGDGELEVFARRTDGAVWRMTVGKTPWEPLKGDVAGDPAAILDSGKHVHVFARGAA